MHFSKRTRLARQLIASMLLLLPVRSDSGWIEDRDGHTIIHLQVPSLPDPNNPNANNRARLAGIELFKRRFPEIFAARYRDRYRQNPDKYGSHDWGAVQVELHRSTGIQIEGIEVDLLQIAGEVAPDILYLNFRKSETYIRAGFLYPLDKPEDGYVGDLSKMELGPSGVERLPQDTEGSEKFQGMSAEELNFRVHPKIWPVIRRAGPENKVQVWAVPYDGVLGKVLTYRKDLFDRYDVEHPTVHWTWDDLLDAARRITNPGIGHYGFALGRGKHESWHWVTFLWSAGGEVMEQGEDHSWKCVFNGNGAAEALDFYLRLSAEKWNDRQGRGRRGFALKDDNQAFAKWHRGEIGMRFAYMDEKVLATANPDIVGMVPVPLGPTGVRGAELNSRMMGLFSGIKDPAVRDAAWEFIRFYDSREAQETKTRVMVEGGLGRFVNPRYLRLFGYPEIERLSPAGWAETFEVAIATARPEPFGKNSNVAYDMMTYPIQEAEQLMLRDGLPADRQKWLGVLQALLDKANARANEEMIGIISAEERALRRLVGAVVLLAIALSFALVFRRISRIFSTLEAPTSPGQGRWDFRRYYAGYILVIPALAAIFVWEYIPVLRGSVMAFSDFQILGEWEWVGVDNFGDLMFDAAWWTSVWNAIRYSFLSIAMTFVPPIALAIFLQEVPKGRLFFRSVYYLPAAITSLVTVLMWKQFYEPSENGALNRWVLEIPVFAFMAIGLVAASIAFAFAHRLRVHQRDLAAVGFLVAGVLMFVGVTSLMVPVLFPPGEPLLTSLLYSPLRLLDLLPEPMNWQSNPDTAMVSCVLPLMWAGMGSGCLIYLAALRGIPSDFFETADIDGAGPIDKILFVVFPMLRPLIIINFVSVFIGSWYGATGNVLMMTGGAGDTEVAGLHIWYKAFTFLKFGPAAAMAWMVGFMLIGFTVHLLKALSTVDFRSTAAAD